MYHSFLVHSSADGHLDSMGEREGGMFQENSIETSILSRVKQITSPGWMHETGARAWCIGKTQRMGWGGRWEGGSGWGTHVNPWLIHVSVWQKPLQYCKAISFQLININEKNKKINKKKQQKMGVGERIMRRSTLRAGRLRGSGPGAIRRACGVCA